MDTPDYPVRHASRGVHGPALSQTDGVVRKNLDEDEFEREVVSFDGIVLDLPGERQRLKKEPVVVRERHAKKGGYDRNGRRHTDERLYNKKRRQILYIMPVMAFVVVAVIMLWGPFANQPQILSAQQASAVSDDSQPNVIPLTRSSDEKPAVNYIETYQTAPDRPRVLTIDSLGVKSRVLEVGLDGRSQPQLPRNSYDAGWYNVSVLPGESGAVVLSGACSGSVGQGVFRRLGELQKGSRIIIEKGDGTQVVYEVAGSENVIADKVDMTKVLAPMYGTDRGLNLMGCTGAYSVKTNDFAERIVIYAVQI